MNSQNGLLENANDVASLFLFGRTFDGHSVSLRETFPKRRAIPKMLTFTGRKRGHSQSVLEIDQEGEHIRNIR